MIALKEKGQKAPDQHVQGMRTRYVVAGDKVTIQQAGRADEEGTITVDGSASPKRMTLATANSLGRGVYELNGDSLRLCVGDAGGDFPAELKSRAVPRADVVTFRLVSTPCDVFAVNGEPEKYAGRVVAFDRAVLLAGTVRRGDRYELQAANENRAKPGNLTFNVSRKLANQLDALGQLPQNYPVRLVCRVRKVEASWHAHVIKIELLADGKNGAREFGDG